MTLKKSLGKSLEDYLEVILTLQHKSGMVRSIDVADYMGFSKPSISRAVKELKAKGLLITDRNRYSKTYCMVYQFLIVCKSKNALQSGK